MTLREFVIENLFESKVANLVFQKRTHRFGFDSLACYVLLFRRYDFEEGRRIFSVIILIILVSNGFGQISTVVSIRATQLRREASHLSKIVFQVSKGTPFELESETAVNGWYFVSNRKSGKKGWIEGKYLRAADNLSIRSRSVDAENKSMSVDLFMKRRKDEWILAGKTQDKEVFLNPSKMRESDGLVNFWQKDVPNSKGIVQKGNDRLLIAYHYVLVYSTVDCETLLYRWNQEIYYDVQGKPLKTIDSIRHELGPVVPDSIGETIAKAVCDYF